MRRLMLVLGALALGVSCDAELKLPSIFSDGMVLQREQRTPVWGWAGPGADVTVSFAGQRRMAKADKAGRFMVRLEKMDASKELRPLVVSCGTESAEVKDVLVGEVWLCAGQSNMRMYVDEAKDFDQEKAAANHPQIRMFVDISSPNIEPQSDSRGSWKVCSPETVGKFYATAYFFGRDIYRELDVPVGLIACAWGGTCIETWTPAASLEKFPSVMASKAEEDAKAKTYDEAAEKVRYAKRLEEWKKRDGQARAEGKKEPRKPRMKKDPHKSENYPGNLFNGRVHPWIPYGIRGAIWYQGECNSYAMDRALLYGDLLENMILQWRKAWDAEFPFYAVQLPNYKTPQVDPVEDDPRAFVREGCLKAMKELPKVGMAVTVDIGEIKSNHPKNKQEVGRRLAQQALAKTYGRKIVAGGPIYEAMKKDGDRIVLKFGDAGSGLVAKDGNLKTFAIAGADRRFVEAQAVIVNDFVVVRSAEVAEPVAVRYAWAINPSECNLFNKEGFPASPFRTDNWPPIGR